MRTQSGYVSGGEWHERPDRCADCDVDCCESECMVAAGASPAIVADPAPVRKPAYQCDDSDAGPWCPPRASDESSIADN
jgi:hypothetical protein